MKINTLHASLLALLTLVINVALGQSKIDIKLTIDTSCACSSVETSKGKFELYDYAPVQKYSDNYTDILIRELEIKKEQTLSVEQGTYKLIYTPSDSSKRKSQYYFASNPYETNIHLNCFFFNKNYHSALDLMEKRDTIVISSSYYGNTHDESIITAHTVVIFKKRKKHYASYYKTEQREPKIDLNPTRFPNIKAQILLSDRQVQLFREFEQNLPKMSINDNLSYEINSKSSIWFNGKKINFYTNNYIALLLWNELNKE